MDSLEDVVRYRQYAHDQEKKELARKLKKQGITMEEYKRQQQEIYGKQWNPKYWDKPGTMETGTAIFFYIVAMVGGCIFVDRIYIWIAATYLFIKYLTRHK